MLQTEHFFNCPYCGAEISILLEIADRPQEYIEDCEVCCNPIEVRYSIEEEEVSDFDAVSIG